MNSHTLRFLKEYLERWCFISINDTWILFMLVVVRWEGMVAAAHQDCWLVVARLGRLYIACCSKRRYTGCCSCGGCWITIFSTLRILCSTTWYERRTRRVLYMDCLNPKQHVVHQIPGIRLSHGILLQMHIYPLYGNFANSWLIVYRFQIIVVKSRKTSANVRGSSRPFHNMTSELLFLVLLQICQEMSTIKFFLPFGIKRWNLSIKRIDGEAVWNAPHHFGTKQLINNLSFLSFWNWWSSIKL